MKLLAYAMQRITFFVNSFHFSFLFTIQLLKKHTKNKKIFKKNPEKIDENCGFT